MYSKSVFDFLGPLILLCYLRAGQKIQHLREESCMPEAKSKVQRYIVGVDVV